MPNLYDISPLDNAGVMLAQIQAFGWLRPQEFALLRHGYNVHGRKYAEAAARRLRAEGLILPRQLPHHGGTALVLARGGAQLLNFWHEGMAAKSGKDIGETVAGGWRPPADWQHHLAAVGTLAHLSALGWQQVIPEKILRGQEPDAAKHPDGIAVDADGIGYWLEVENARKTGRNLAHLAAALAGAARGAPVVAYDAVQHAPVRRALIAIEPAAKDERGYAVDHLARLVRKLQKMGLKAPLPMTVAWLKFSGYGVAGIRLENHIIQPV